MIGMSPFDNSYCNSLEFGLFANASARPAFVNDNSFIGLLSWGVQIGFDATDHDDSAECYERRRLERDTIACHDGYQCHCCTSQAKTYLLYMVEIQSMLSPVDGLEVDAFLHHFVEG